MPGETRPAPLRGGATELSQLVAHLGDVFPQQADQFRMRLDLGGRLLVAGDGLLAGADKSGQQVADGLEGHVLAFGTDRGQKQFAAQPVNLFDKLRLALTVGFSDASDKSPDSKVRRPDIRAGLPDEMADAGLFLTEKPGDHIGGAS